MAWKTQSLCGKVSPWQCSDTLQSCFFSDGGLQIICCLDPDLLWISSLSSRGPISNTRYSNNYCIRDVLAKPRYSIASLIPENIRFGRKSGHMQPPSPFGRTMSDTNLFDLTFSRDFADFQLEKARHTCTYIQHTCPKPKSNKFASEIRAPGDPK